MTAMASENGKVPQTTGLLPFEHAIPSTWKSVRNRYLFRAVDQRSQDGEETHLSMSQIHGLVPRSEIDEWRLQSESYAGGKLCRTNDLVLNRLKAHLGVFARARQEGVISPDYTVLRPIADISVRYFEFLFKTPPYIAEFRRSTRGIVEGFWRLYTDDFYNIRSVVPPRAEQDAIVSYLDRKLADIDRFITKKRRLIHLLEEERLANTESILAGTTVAKRSNKKTNIPWLPAISRDWNTIPLQFAAKSLQTGPFGSQLHSYEYVTGAIPVINPSHMRHGRVIPDPQCSVDEQTAERLAVHRVRSGDIVFARRGEMGRCVLIRESQAGWICGTGGLRMRPRDGLFDGEYLLRVLLSRGVAEILSLHSVGTVMDNLNEAVLHQIELPLPPLEEQQRLVTSIDMVHERINSAIERIHVEIQLMKEFRTSLIADSVTGKVNVT